MVPIPPTVTASGQTITRIASGELTSAPQAHPPGMEIREGGSRCCRAANQEAEGPSGRGPKLLPQEGKPRAFVNPNPGRNRLGRRATVSRNAGGRSTAAAPSAILRTMRSSWLTRLKVVVLATVVLSGGSGLPMLDALLYHTGGSRGVSQPGRVWVR